MGGCGKTRCEVPHRLEPHPEELCSLPVKIGRGDVVPKCLDMITTKMVIDRIRWYFEGGSYFYDDEEFKPQLSVPELLKAEEKPAPAKKKKKPNPPKIQQPDTIQESAEPVEGGVGAE